MPDPAEALRILTLIKNLFKNSRQDLSLSGSLLKTRQGEVPERLGGFGLENFQCCAVKYRFVGIVRSFAGYGDDDPEDGRPGVASVAEREGLLSDVLSESRDEPSGIDEKSSAQAGSGSEVATRGDDAISGRFLHNGWFKRNLSELFFFVN